LLTKSKHWRANLRGNYPHSVIFTPRTFKQTLDGGVFQFNIEMKY
jgi:hypothetical protein